MQQFLSAIKKSVEEKNWFAALFLSLAMPDICAQTENPSQRYARDIGAKYQAWFDKYLSHYYAHPDQAGVPTGFLARDCWSFRCKCLHQGLTAVERESINKFSFRAPIAPQGNIVIGILRAKGEMSIQIDDFAIKVCQGVEKWLEDVSDDKAVTQRIAELLEINDEHYAGIVRIN
ncbi:hypothetical protein [Enterobacter bugandensis]|uniref:hypothetical protein n=1 Tax=Enterobacter bugandensis TaxID=881260 RepID=UPI0018FE2CE2|nr:hypothetical protein [Enterobacter bugandensis]MBG0678317.1 hypothetical protein [Enterobacter bugandensis]